MSLKKGVKEREYIPLSSGQIPFYTGQRLNPDRPIYNMPFAFNVFSKVDVETFQLAFQHLVNKTDVLRTVFEEVKGVPYQYILDTYDYHMMYSDFSDYDDESMSIWLENEAKKMLSFDLPLFESRIIKRNENHYIWYFNQHHLITDAWACTILFRNCIDLYFKLLKGEAIDSSPYPGYKTFVENLHSENNSTKRNKVADYWNEKYKRLPENLRLYGNHEQELTTISNRIKINLGGKRSKKIRELAGLSELRSWTPDATYFNVFSTIFYIFLYRISQSEHISIDIPFHNRTSSIHKETAGAFIEMFPLLIHLERNDTFLEIYKKVKLEVNEVFKNIEKGASINKHRKSSSAVLNYINADFKKFTDLEVSSELIHSGHVDRIHQIRMQVYDFDSEGEFKLYFELNHSVFEKEKNRFVPEQFINLVDQFLNDIHQSISAKPIISREEAQLLSSVYKGKTLNDIAPDYVLKLFKKSVDLSPKQIAIKDNVSSQLTYLKLDQFSNQFANYLDRHKIGLGHTVAFHTYRSPALVIGILGTLKAGASFLPISSNTPAERVKFILEDSNAKLLISHDDLPGTNSNGSTMYLSADQLAEEIASFDTSRKSQYFSPGTEAYMIYTSGSTGNPKGVKISRHSLNNYIHHAKTTYLKSVAPQMPLYSMIGFDLTITSIFLPLVAGGSVHVFKESSLNSDLSILDVIREDEINIMKITPSHWDLISGFDFSESDLKTLIVGGEAFKPSQANSMRQAFPKGIDIFNEYGPTEATVGCIVHRLDPKERYERTVPIGSPIANMECFILDQSLNQVPIGVVGQLYLAGVGLAAGYQNNHELTNEKFIAHRFNTGQKMYATGDFGRYNHDHQIEYLGRKDEQIKIRGVRVELGEIESAIANLEEIENCAVTYIMSEIGCSEELERADDYRLALHYTGKTIDEQKLRQQLKNHLPSYLIPTHFVRLEELPLTKNGKIDRKVLNKIVQKETLEVSRQQIFTAPEGEIEEILVDIWQDVIGIDKMSTSYNFLEIGGNSLAAIRINSRIAEAMHLEIPIVSIFDNPTIKELGNFIEERLEVLLGEN